MAYRYYSTQRPVAPGTFPNHDVKFLHNFSNRIFVDSIQHEAWGYLDYSVRLTAEEEQNYELVFCGYVESEVC